MAMKHFNILFPVAVAAAMFACSDMAVDEKEAVSENFPADFVDATYIALHPELVRAQIRDYVKAYNAKLDDSVKVLTSAGDTLAKVNYANQKALDSVTFFADTAALHMIFVNPQLGGFTEEDWALDWGGGSVDSLVATTKTDTTNLAIDDASQPECTPIKIAVTKGGIVYDDAGNITSVAGDITCKDGSPLVSPLTITADMKLNAKGTKVKIDTLKIDTIPVLIAGSISVEHVKLLKQLNFYDNVQDLQKLLEVPLDTFAVSYQYVLYGKLYGWAYRQCSETEKNNPIITETYPATKLYCDDNGIVREIN